MKILQVSTVGFADPRYYRSNEFTLCRSLARLGHDVTLFASDMHPKWQLLEDRRIEKTVEVLDGFTIRRFPRGFELGIVPVMPTLLREMLRFECDIVHAHTILAPSSFYSALFARMKERPLVVTQHDYLFGAAHGIKLFVHMLNNDTFGRYTMHTADMVLGLSSSAVKFAERFGAASTKTRFVPNSIDTSLFRPDQKNLLREKFGIENNVVLFVAKLTKDKAPLILLRAFRDTALAVPDAKLVILGRGPLESQVRELQRQLKLENLFFLPRIPREEMPMIYTGADFLVLPSLYEPFGNVVLEAMASGLPVIGSDIGGMADIILHGETGFHVVPGNQHQLSDYMQQLLTDDALRKRMSSDARRIAVERFDDMVLARTVEKIYSECLSR